MPVYEIETADGVFEVETDRATEPTIATPTTAFRDRVDKVAQRLRIPDPELPRFVREHGDVLGAALAAELATGPLPVLPTMGIVGGAAAGARATRRLIENRRLAEERKRGLGEIGKEAVFEGALQSVGGAAGRGMAAGAQRFLRGFSRAADPSAVAADVALKKVGGGLTAAQQTSSSVLDFAENIARSGILTGTADDFKRFDDANAQAVNNMGRVIARKIARKAAELSDTEFGKTFTNIIDDSRKLFSELAKRKYAQLDKLVAQAGQQVPFFNPLVSQVRRLPGAVNITSLKQMAASHRGLFSELRGIGETQAGGKLIKQIMNLGNDISFQSAQTLRSVLLAMQRDVVAGQTEARAAGLIRQAAAITDNAIEQAGKRLKGKALQAFRSANKFFREGKEAFEDDFILRLFVNNKVTPERIGESIFRTGNVTEVQSLIRALKKGEQLGAVKFTTAMNQVRQKYYESLLNSSLDQASNINFSSLSRQISRPKLSRTINTVLDKSQSAALRDFVQVGRIVQEGSKAGTGAFGLAQMGAALTAVSGPITGQFVSGVGLAVFLAPPILKRILTNPTSVRMLVRGMVLPTGSKELAQIVSRLSATYLAGDRGN